MILVFEALCFSKHFIPQPYVADGQGDGARRFLGRGWGVKTSGYPQHQNDEFQTVIECYLNETLKDSLQNRVMNLVHRGFTPAACATGMFFQFGIGGFPVNVSSAHELISKGIDEGVWSCFDLSAFITPQPDLDVLKKASSKGGVWSSLRYIQELIKIGEYKKAVKVLQTLCASATNGWWKWRRSGESYAQSVGSILGVDNGARNVKQSWENLKHLASGSNLPAALWVSEGYITGEIGEKNPRKAVEVLLPFAEVGLWNFDLNDILDADDLINKTGLVEMASQAGNSAAKALLEFPELLT